MYGYLLVFVGGGLGSICRYGISHLLSSFQTTFPYATLLANIFSCIILGIFVGLNFKGDGVSMEYRFLIMTGFCGGFSTFSTFTNETFQLFSAGHFLFGIANIFFSLVICLASLYLGIRVAGP